MNSLSRMSAGIGIFILSVFVVRTILVAEVDLRTSLWLLCYAVLLAGIGGYLLFNTTEDEIDQINE